MSTITFDPARIKAETLWLQAHPHFEQKPASITEFLDVGYLDIKALIRPGMIKAFIDIFGEEVNGSRISNYERALFSGGIGVGKTTFSSIALTYMAHWILCLRDPQAYFKLLPGSRIALMQMSTSAKQASEVIFGDLKARVENSEWFINNFPHDPSHTKQLRFPKDIWILPGDSAETSFEGYNVLVGILDEMDSHKVTDSKDYAELGFNAIESRIASRFVEYGDDGEKAGHLGLLICIGQMKKGNGFAARKFKEFKADPKAYTMIMSIWESLGWDKFTRKDGTRNSFWYDVKRKKIIPTLLAGMIKNDNLIEIPNAYLTNFKNNPEKALRDLAGIPPSTSDPFISLTDRIDECEERWIEHFGEESPVDDSTSRPKFAEWFRANNDPRKRHIHLDLAVSAEGDALGMAMGYVSEVREIDGETKPYIIIDFLARIKATPGTEIMLSDVRRIIYDLKEERKFRVYSVSLDGWQSVDTMQQLRKKRYRVDYLSVDKSTLPYEDLREAIYERRLEFPRYMTYLKKGDTNLIDVAVLELTTLQFTGKKVDHSPDGSKDVADALAGVVSTLMGERVYRKGVTSINMGSSEEEDLEATGTENVLMFPKNKNSMQAPIPPSVGGMMGLTIPERLRPR